MVVHVLYFLIAIGVSVWSPMVIGQATTSPKVVVGSSVLVSTTGGTPTFSSTTPSVCTVHNNTIVGVAPGNCTITLTMTIAWLSQTIGSITFRPTTLAVGSTLTVSATTTSGLPVTYRSTTPCTCAVLGSTVTALSAGTCTITANQSGNNNYSAAPQTTQNITVGKGSQTIGSITFRPATLTPQGTTTIGATASSGLAVAIASTTPSICTVNTNTVTGIAAGTCTVAANQSGNSNWNAASPVTQNITVAPLPHYIDNHDGTVSDTTTGLMWKRCTEGQSWDGTICNGNYSTYTYVQATTLTSSFAGHTDWRLPNIRELTTITDFATSSPAIDTTAFPNAPVSSVWSVSKVPGQESIFAWSVNFTEGFDVWSYQTNYYYSVRLVRGESGNLLSEARPTTDYVDNGDGTITHTPTHLTWKRCAEGQTWNGTTCSGDSNTYGYEQATALTDNFAGHTDWRIPTEQELRSLADYTIASPGPTMNTTIFPNAPSSHFWSNSSVNGYSMRGWNVYFMNGLDDWPIQSNGYNVRLVRLEQ